MFSIAFTNPKLINNDTNELPPKETNGRVVPVTGSSPVLTLAFIKNWMKIIKATANTKRLASVLFTLIATRTNLNTSSDRIIITILTPKNPSSSPMKANIKSVLSAGKKSKCDCVPLPKPLPTN